MQQRLKEYLTGKHMISDYQRNLFDHEVEARLFNNKIIEPRFKEEVERNKIRVKYH